MTGKEQLKAVVVAVLALLVFLVVFDLFGSSSENRITGFTIHYPDIGDEITLTEGENFRIIPEEAVGKNMERLHPKGIGGSCDIKFAGIFNDVDNEYKIFINILDTHVGKKMKIEVNNNCRLFMRSTDMNLKQGDNFRIIQNAFLGKTLDQILGGCRGKIDSDKVKIARITTENYQPFGLSKIFESYLDKKLLIVADNDCKLENPTISMNLAPEHNYRSVTQDMMGKTIEQRSGTCTITDYAVKDSDTNRWERFEEGFTFRSKDVGDILYILVAEKEGCIFNLPATSKIVRSRKEAVKKAQVTSTTAQDQILTQKFNSNTVELIKGWNLISVTQPMVGKSIGQMSIQVGKAEKCASDKAWIFFGDKWEFVETPNLKEPFKTVVDLDAFTQDYVGLGMWLNILNEKGCILGCGLAGCA